MIERLAQNGICSSCLASLKKCDACDQPALSGVEMQDGTGRIFCQTCAGTLPRCFICGAPVDGRGCVVGEGRFRCHICSTSAVDDPLQAHRLYLEVQETMAKTLGMELGVPTALVPMDTTQFQAMLQTQVITDAHSSELRMPRGLYVRKGRKRGIYLELGLPRVATIEVIAHELGHAWQVERSPLLTDPVLVEGFAEWVAFRVLDILGEVAATEVMMKRSDIYGKGLRQILSWHLDDAWAVLERSNE